MIESTQIRVFVRRDRAIANTDILGEAGIDSRNEFVRGNSSERCVLIFHRASVSATREERYARRVCDVSINKRGSSSPLALIQACEATRFVQYVVCPLTFYSHN